VSKRSEVGAQARAFQMQLELAANPLLQSAHTSAGDAHPLGDGVLRLSALESQLHEGLRLWIQRLDERSRGSGELRPLERSVQRFAFVLELFTQAVVFAQSQSAGQSRSIDQQVAGNPQ
jgi:hypothetical protein